jgi:hypothetical protein
MIGYQAGLWEAGAGALLLVIVVSLSRSDRVSLVGSICIGLALALAYMALDHAVAVTCGSSYQPTSCAATAGPDTASYVIRAVACALAGVIILGLGAVLPRGRRERQDRAAPSH